MTASTKFQIPAQEDIVQAHTAPIYALQIRANYLVTGSADGTIRRWDLTTGRLIGAVIPGTDKSVVCLQFDERPDQDVLIAGGVDGTLRVLRFSTGEVDERVEGAHEDSILALAFDERWIVSGGRDKIVRVWNRGEVKDWDLLPIAYRQLAGEARGSVVIPYSQVGEFAVHQAAVNAIQLHGDYIVAGSGDRTIHVLNLQSGEKLKTFRAGAGIADLHFNGRLLLAGCSDGSCTIWDVDNGTEKARIEGPRTVIRAVDAISGDQGDFTRLAIGKYNGTVQIYEKDSHSAEETWVVTSTLEYGKQPELISNENPYVHSYPEGDRVFDVCFRGNQVFCCGQGNVVVGWTLPEEL